MCSVIFIKHRASSRMEYVNTVMTADLSTRPIPFLAWSIILVWDMLTILTRYTRLQENRKYIEHHKIN